MAELIFTLSELVISLLVAVTDINMMIFYNLLILKMEFMV